MTTQLETYISLEDAARKLDVPIDLPELEALALIRAAYADDDGGWASLDDARLIHACIMGQK